MKHGILALTALLSALLMLVSCTDFGTESTPIFSEQQVSVIDLPSGGSDPADSSEPESSWQPTSGHHAIPSRQQRIPSFQPLSTHYFYNSLTTVQKNLYAYFYDHQVKMKSGYTDSFLCLYEDIQIAEFATRCDHPEIFWVPASYMISSTQGTSLYAISYQGYTHFSTTVLSMQTQLQEAADAFARTLSPEQTEYEVALAAHDWLANRVEYDSKAAEHEADYPDSFTAYGALVKGKAVCEGYAKAYQLLLNRVGMNCITVNGALSADSTAGHMWNMVQVGTSWYHVDVTSDDQQVLTHFRFMQSDASFRAKGYVIDGPYDGNDPEASFNINRPAGFSNQADYYRMTGYLIDSMTPGETLTDALKRAASRGKKSLELYVSDAIGADLFDIQFYCKDLTVPGIKGLHVAVIGTSNREFILYWQ